MTFHDIRTGARSVGLPIGCYTAVCDKGDLITVCELRSESRSYRVHGSLPLKLHSMAAARYEDGCVHKYEMTTSSTKTRTLKASP